MMGVQVNLIAPNGTPKKTMTVFQPGWEKDVMSPADLAETTRNFVAGLIEAMRAPPDPYFARTFYYALFDLKLAAIGGRRPQ